MEVINQDLARSAQIDALIAAIQALNVTLGQTNALLGNVNVNLELVKLRLPDSLLSGKLKVSIL